MNQPGIRQATMRRMGFNTEYTMNVLEMAFQERRRQVQLGRSGEIAHACEDPGTGDGYRLAVLGEEFGEVGKAIAEDQGADAQLREYIHTAAVALACAEACLRNMDMKPRPEGLMFSEAEKPDNIPGPIARPENVSDSNYIKEEVSDGSYIKVDTLPDLYLQVLQECRSIYEERGKRRGELWRRQGWRGQLFNMRTCMERVWTEFWNADPSELARKMKAGELDDDNLLDLINYTVFCIVLIRLADRDGLWEYSE